MLKLGSLFDGIGGWPLAAIKLGINPVWSSEIEPFPQEITKTHFPSMKHLGDITKINGAEIEPVDIITLGSPCQDLSIAGKREGLDGERSGLFRRAVDIVRQMRNATNGKYPRFIVWENVTGAFGSNKGADFRTVLEEIAETEIPMPASGRWATAGMVRSKECEVAWRVLDAKYWGVPQRRKRIFLVADFRSQCAGEILFKPESVSRDFEKGKSTGQRFAGDIKDSIRTPIWDIGDRRRVLESIDISPTLLSKMGTGGNNVPIVRTTIGFDSKDSIKQSMPCLIEKTPPIKTNNRIGVYDMTHANDVIRTVSNGIVPTINARMGTGGNQVPVVQEPVYSMGHDERSASFTPNKTDPLTASDYKQPVIVNTRYKVRRLTPTECERLQGLPDGYTLIDDKKCSDSARYKALGNGMAQPCPDFIMEGIASVFRRDNLG